MSIVNMWNTPLGTKKIKMAAIKFALWPSVSGNIWILRFWGSRNPFGKFILQLGRPLIHKSKMATSLLLTLKPLFNKKKHY